MILFMWTAILGLNSGSRYSEEQQARPPQLSGALHHLFRFPEMSTELYWLR